MLLIIQSALLDINVLCVQAARNCIVRFKQLLHVAKLSQIASVHENHNRSKRERKN